MSAGETCVDRRRTTSAALTKALSVRRGCDACPGVPRMVSVHQWVPFSPVMTGKRTPEGVAHRKPTGFGDDVVATHCFGHLSRSATGLRGSRAPPRRPRAMNTRSPRGRNPSSARWRTATVIEAVRFSMSTAPRPHTSPSMSSPAERIMAPVLAVGRHDVGVAEEQERGGFGVGALDPGHERGAAGTGLVDLEVQARSFEHGPDHLAAPGLLARLRGAVVHAGVADELLEQLGHLAGQALPSRPHPTASVGVGPPARLRMVDWGSHGPLRRRRRWFEHRHRRAFHPEPGAAGRSGPCLPGGVPRPRGDRCRGRQLRPPHRSEAKWPHSTKPWPIPRWSRPPPEPSAAATPFSCVSPSGWAARSFPTTPSRSSTGSTPGSSTRTG